MTTGKSYCAKHSVPGPPAHVKIDVEGNSANISWALPVPANGEIENYNVTVNGTVVATVAASPLWMDVPDLCGSFDVQVSAKNQLDWGPYSKPVSASIDDNGECDHFLQITAYTDDDTHILVVLLTASTFKSVMSRHRIPPTAD